MINCKLAKNFEFIIVGIQFEKVRTCVDLFCMHRLPDVKIKCNRFVLKSTVSKILK